MQYLIEALERLHRAKNLNESFGAVLAHEYTVELLATLVRNHAVRHAWRMLGMQGGAR